MAKKKPETVKVFCRECIHSGQENNYLIECLNEQVNPKGYKMGL